MMLKIWVVVLLGLVGHFSLVQAMGKEEIDEHASPLISTSRYTSTEEETAVKIKPLIKKLLRRVEKFNTLNEEEKERFFATYKELHAQHVSTNILSLGLFTAVSWTGAGTYKTNDKKLIKIEKIFEENGFLKKPASPFESIKQILISSISKTESWFSKKKAD